MSRNLDRRLIELLRSNLELEEALFVIGSEVTGVSEFGGRWTLLGIKRLEFMAPIVRAFPEYREREWTRR